MTTSASARHWFLRAGSRHIQRDAVRAAVGRTTIHHRSTSAHRYVLGLKGCFGCRLLGEIADMDTRPNRTRAALQALGRHPGGWPVRRGYTGGPQGARSARRPPPDPGTAALDIERIPVSPKPITIDGERLDSLKHIQPWRERETTPMTTLRLSAHAGPRAALVAVLDSAGRWQIKAACLNTDGIGSVRDRAWAGEKGRRLARRLPSREFRA